jgi:hypothetical protein
VADNAETTITLTDVTDDDASAVITNGLRAYNEAQAGCWDGRPLAIFVRDLETKKVAGGLLGRYVARPLDGGAIFSAGGFEARPT